MLHATSSTFDVGGTTFNREDNGENDGEDHGESSGEDPTPT